MDTRWHTMTTNSQEEYYRKELPNGVSLIVMPTFIYDSIVGWAWAVRGPQRDSSGYLMVHARGTETSTARAKKAADAAMRDEEEDHPPTLLSTPFA